MKSPITAITFLSLLLAQGSFAAVRVALMDFAVDDNSYLSAQTASSFTSLLQNELSHEPEIEWVERSQLDLARREFKLRELELLGGSSGIRLGKWLNADWLVNGKFSLDDQGRRTLSIEITDLNHADVLASQTLAFPGEATSPMKLQQSQTQFAAPVLKQLFLKARQRAEESRRQTVIAPLFFFDARLPLYGRRDEFEPLRNAFYERVEKLEAAHSSVRMIRFPKAYSAMDESAMVLDGLVESGISSWENMADVYLWGIYSNVFIATPSRTNAHKFLREKHHHLSLHVWDGVSAPFTYESQYRKPELERLTVSDSQDFWDRLEKEIALRSAKGKTSGDKSDARREAANSILKLFTPANSRNPSYESARFIENVRLIEAACFLDPDNARAQFLRIKWRWGNWLDYQPAVKNPFWSKWRRSKAWGNYVDKFGFEIPGALKASYDRTEIPRIYVSSLENVLQAFPQQIETSSTSWAQKDGFPKDIPPERIAEWKTQVAAELAERTTKAQAYLNQIGEKYVFPGKVAPLTNAPPKFQTSALPPATNMPPATIPPRVATTNRPTLTARTNPKSPLPTAPRRSVAQPLPKVDFKLPWMPKSEDRSLFRLRAPNLWPVEVKPAITQIVFPAHFDTKTILKIVPWREQLVVLVVDERSAPSDELNAEVSEELLTSAGRLWLVKEGSPPKLLTASGMPETVHAFLIENDRLWVAAQDFGYLDLKQQQFKICQKAEGSDTPDEQAIALSNGILYTLQYLRVTSFDPGTSKWRELPRENGRSPYGTSAGIQSILSANQGWLCYSANFPSFYNISRQEWTNVLSVNGTTCLCAEKSGFWLGGWNGLHFYDPDRASLESWHPPAVFYGLRRTRLDLKTLARDPGDVPGWAEGFSDTTPEVFRPSIDATNKMIKFMPPRREPLRLSSRIPGRVQALLADGNHLWLAISDRLVLLDLPSRSLVACCHFGGPVACIGILGEDVWVGLAYGQQLLARVPKADFYNVPKKAWKSLPISDQERTQLIQQMNLHDRVMYEFYAGNISGIAKALDGLPPSGTNIDVMLLAAFANGPCGVDNPPLARAWCQQILAHQPADSTWSRFAQKELNDCEQNHKTRQYQDSLLTKFDRNGDGILDEDEQKVMQKSSEFQRETKTYQEDVLMPQIEALLRKYDSNKDGKLSSRKLESVRSAVKFLAENSSERLDRYKAIVAPVLTKAFPPVEKLLKQYDVNKDGALDATELKAFAEDLRR